MAQAGDSLFFLGNKPWKPATEQAGNWKQGHSAVSLGLISSDLVGEAPSPPPAPELSRDSSPRQQYGTMLPGWGGSDHA